MVFLNGTSVRMRIQTNGTAISSVMSTLEMAKKSVLDKIS